MFKQINYSIRNAIIYCSWQNKLKHLASLKSIYIKFKKPENLWRIEKLYLLCAGECKIWIRWHLQKIQEGIINFSLDHHIYTAENSPQMLKFNHRGKNQEYLSGLKRWDIICEFFSTKKLIKYCDFPCICKHDRYRNKLRIWMWIILFIIEVWIKVSNSLSLCRTLIKVSI